MTRDVQIMKIFDSVFMDTWGIQEMNLWVYGARVWEGSAYVSEVANQHLKESICLN